MRVLTPLESQRIDAEEKALDAIHAVLRANPRGATPRAMADASGLGIGFIAGVLRKQTLVLKRRGKTSRLWYADWTDIDPGFRPKAMRSGISG